MAYTTVTGSELARIFGALGVGGEPLARFLSACLPYARRYDALDARARAALSKAGHRPGGGLYLSMSAEQIAEAMGASVRQAKRARAKAVESGLFRFVFPGCKGYPAILEFSTPCGDTSECEHVTIKGSCGDTSECEHVTITVENSEIAKYGDMKSEIGCHGGRNMVTRPNVNMSPTINTLLIPKTRARSSAAFGGPLRALSEDPPPCSACGSRLVVEPGAVEGLITLVCMNRGCARYNVPEVARGSIHVEGS